MVRMTGADRFNVSVAFRSAALFAILYQFRLVADDLADTAVFSVTLIAAFAAAAVLAGVSIGGKRMRPLAAIITIGLIPWIARAFIAAPGLLFSGGSYPFAVIADSLLLNFDRNNFVSLLPFYWAAVTTWFSMRSRIFLRGAIIADAVLLMAVFGFTAVPDIAVYRWPIVMIGILAGIVFAQAIALLFSLPPEIKPRPRERIAAISVILVLVFVGGLIFLKPSQERAAQKGGGLLEPKLFSFDFSQFLRLDTEISMGDDLIMIVKKDSNDNHILLRRSVLSGYSKRQGFYRVEDIDEKTHPQRLPPRPTLLSPMELNAAQRVRQEYFLVNFDAAAFIGMNEPVEIIPYESWDSSSFKSAYAVESLVSVFSPEDNFISWPDSQSLGLSAKEWALYTAYDGDERIRSLAETVTNGIDRYGDKVYAIHDWLKYGEYRYSLKPGIAPDGDQLAWFLFQSKKGYCSYYAFAMALMLRSQGIPARVAAGFYIDTETEIFDYYPVRADMAHAWVEVPFPGYGWVEFDPTSVHLAEGEEFRFSDGVDPSLLERLMREILENRARLKVKMGQESGDALTDTHSLARLTAFFVETLLAPLVILVIIILFVAIRCGYLFLAVINHNARRKAVNLWKHSCRRLRLAGWGCPSSLPESEWALRGDNRVAGTYALYLACAAARFAPEYQMEDFTVMRGVYRRFSESYRRSVSPWRRFLAWIFPPIALIRGNGKLAALLLLVFLAGMDGRAQNTGTEIIPGADALFGNALEAEYSEYWERAIDLYKEGSAQYPLDPRFPRALGHLYYSRALYGLAWEEYRKVELINPYDTYILLRMANTAAYLNHDRTSVTYLEKLLAINPDNKEAINSLGWMYYKVHRLEDGERLLVSAIERFGEEADFSMTMATIYLDMYRYDEGKYWYQKAIALAEPMRSFVAVAHYNLSILESRFYRYDLAMNEANASLDAQNRASGLLARGELNIRRLELEKAQTDFQDAREIDSSPLAKFNLAQIYQISGKLEEARLYALDCLKASDHSWMINYGIDPIRYKRDIHEILHKIYGGLTHAERFVPCETPGKMIRSRSRSIMFRFYTAVHHKLYQKYSLAAADAYNTQFVYNNDGVPPLDQLIQYYNAFETYPRRALFYLDKAQNFETALIPASENSYNLEKGTLLQDQSLILKALNGFDPVWERELISQAYRERALYGRPRAIRQSAAVELFALNRGALLQAGIGLPLEINLRSAGGKEKILLRTLTKAGFIPVSGDGATRFRLDITIQDRAISAALTDTEGEKQPFHRTFPLHSLSKADIYNFARTLSGAVFKIE